jgi:ribA/ribD-fused uncharacterized protein
MRRGRLPGFRLPRAAEFTTLSWQEIADERAMHAQPETSLYSRSRAAVFFLTTGPLGKLSNMAKGMPIGLGWIRTGASENLYQAIRFPRDPDLQAAILAAPSPMESKEMARAAAERTRADWMQVRIPAMAWTLAAKQVCSEAFDDELRSTGARPIVEESRRDDFWGAMAEGADGLRGMNVLGKLLDWRKSLPRPLETVAPEFPDPILLGRPLEAGLRPGGARQLGLF